MLHVSPPTFKPVLQQSVASVAGVNTDSSLDKITGKSGHTQELRHLLQASLTWAGKITEQHEQILLQKQEYFLLSETTLRNMDNRIRLQDRCERG